MIGRLLSSVLADDSDLMRVLVDRPSVTFTADPPEQLSFFGYLLWRTANRVKFRAESLHVGLTFPKGYAFVAEFPAVFRRLLAQLEKVGRVSRRFESVWMYCAEEEESGVNRVLKVSVPAHCVRDAIDPEWLARLDGFRRSAGGIGLCWESKDWDSSPLIEDRVSVLKHDFSTMTPVEAICRLQETFLPRQASMFVVRRHIHEVLGCGWDDTNALAIWSRYGTDAADSLSDDDINEKLRALMIR